MSDRLALSAQDLRAFGEAVSDLVASYYDSLSERAVLEHASAAALREALAGPMPLEGTALPELLATVRDVIVRYSRHNGHPRMFGYVASPGAPIAALGSMIEAALNANVTAWRSAPSATELEFVAIDWLKEMLGYPEEATGLFVSGGSMANFAGLAAARSAKAPDVVRRGVAASGRTLRLLRLGRGAFLHP